MRTGDNQPVIDYNAVYPTGSLYPDGTPIPANTPILKMLDSNMNIVHSDLTAIITGPYGGRFPGTNGVNQPEKPCNSSNNLEASRQFGWRRNLLVNGMQTGRTQTIGVIIPPYDSFWVSVLSGIHDALSAADYLPITVWTGNLERMPHFEEGDTEGKKQINRLLDRRVDGLIMWPTFSLAYYHHFPEFVERRVPVAVIDHYSTVADSVETD
jgi:hypothetical protein